MRISLAFLYVALTPVWAADGFAQGAATVWDHNGSQVHLSANGARRQFHYQVPSADLTQLGVQAGTLLFDGRRDGYQYSGTAYVFSKVCGARAYAVAGPVSPDQRAVTMYGKAPIVDSNCRVVEYRDDVLVFNLSPPVEVPANQDFAEQNTPQETQRIAPSQQAYDSEYDKFVQQWWSCLNTEQSIDVTIVACDSALSFPRLIADDRTKLTQRRATLTQKREELREKQREKQPQEQREEPRGRNSSTIAHDLFTVPLNLNRLAIGGGIITMLFVSLYIVHHYRLTGIQLPARADNSLESPNQSPSQSMALKLKRSQRSSFMGKILFVLDARIGINAEEYSMVRKYRLGGRLVYDSSARKRHTERTKQHLEMTGQRPPMFAGFTTQLLGLGKTLYRVGRALASATMVSLSTRITVDSLIRGAHVECESMEELLEAENAIIEAFRNLKAHLETAETFDGRETVIEH